MLLFSEALHGTGCRVVEKTQPITGVNQPTKKEKSATKVVPTMFSVLELYLLINILYNIIKSACVFYVYLHFVDTGYSRYGEKQSVNSVVITHPLPSYCSMYNKEAPGLKH